MTNPSVYDVISSSFGLGQSFQCKKNLNKDLNLYLFLHNNYRMASEDL